MFKISFKDTPNNPSKLVTRFGAVTEVILEGKVQLPEFWNHIPTEIYDWTYNIEYIELYENLEENTLTIYSGGKSRCAEGDKFSPILGERIAEARAKLKIYKYFSTLSEKLCDYYGKIIYGNGPVIEATNKGLMGATTKYDQLARREEEHIKNLINSISYDRT